MAWWVRIFAAKFEDPHGSRRKRESYKLSVSHSLTATYILWHVKNLNIKKNYQITKRMNLADMSPIIKVYNVNNFTINK